MDCEIRVRGTLTGDWSAWFAGMQQLNDTPDETVLVGSLPDQAALFGVLALIRNLDLQLISVRVEATPTGSSGKRP
ncbi:MAG TPA: hypothetical protein VGL40_00860 [Bacillota bacterium]